MSGGNVDVENCKFSGNWATSGGGVYAEHCPGDSAATFTNCLFAGNYGESDGGGILLSGNDAVGNVTNCTFFWNTTQGNVGGLAIAAGASASVRNSILWGNTNSSGSGIDAQVGTTNVQYSCMEGWTPGWEGIGNIGRNPLFRDPRADDDFRLLSGSPAIDAGDNNAVPQDTWDLDGDGDVDLSDLAALLGVYGNTCP